MFTHTKILNDLCRQINSALSTNSAQTLKKMDKISTNFKKTAKLNNIEFTYLSSKICSTCDINKSCEICKINPFTTNPYEVSFYIEPSKTEKLILTITTFDNIDPTFTVACEKGLSSTLPFQLYCENLNNPFSTINILNKLTFMADTSDVMNKLIFAITEPGIKSIVCPNKYINFDNLYEVSFKKIHPLVKIGTDKIDKKNEIYYNAFHENLSACLQFFIDEKIVENTAGMSSDPKIIPEITIYKTKELQISLLKHCSKLDSSYTMRIRTREERKEKIMDLLFYKNDLYDISKTLNLDITIGIITNIGKYLTKEF